MPQGLYFTNSISSFLVLWLDLAREALWQGGWARGFHWLLPCRATFIGRTPPCFAPEGSSPVAAGLGVVWFPVTGLPFCLVPISFHPPLSGTFLPPPHSLPGVHHLNPTGRANPWLPGELPEHMRVGGIVFLTFHGHPFLSPSPKSRKSALQPVSQDTLERGKK